MKPTPLKNYVKTCDKALCRRRAWWRINTGDTIFYLCSKHMDNSQGEGKGNQLNGPRPETLTLPLGVNSTSLGREAQGQSSPSPAESPTSLPGVALKHTERRPNEPDR